MSGISLRDLMEGRHRPYLAEQLHMRCDCGLDTTGFSGAWGYFPRNHTFAEHEVFIDLVYRKESVC